jgi:hypothetical protein
MPARGKPGKPEAGFPPFPPALEIASRFPHSHIFDEGYTLINKQQPHGIATNVDPRVGPLSFAE